MTSAKRHPECPGEHDRARAPRWLVLLGVAAALAWIAVRQWWAGFVRARRWSNR